MVRLDVQNDLHGGKKGQEAVGIFTGLGHEHLRAAHTDISANGVQHPPTEMVGSFRASIRISVSMEVVVVFPWVPATATDWL